MECVLPEVCIPLRHYHNSSPGPGFVTIFYLLKRIQVLKNIISAGRRTDIPAFYSEWLIRRLKEGEVYQDG
jgi:hypothetical protein